MIDMLDFNSPLGNVLLTADQEGLLSADFTEVSGQSETSNPHLKVAEAWLETYFSGQIPSDKISLKPQGTEFQLKVWHFLQRIPYGQTVTYGQIAEQLNCKSAQAIGGAVGKNPLLMFIPCHRVLGSQGQLTGYSGGLARKQFLLGLETDNEDVHIL